MKRLSWYWALPGAAGLALVMAAVLLLVTMTAGKTPAASADAEGCTVTVTKVADPSPTVLPGQDITYTITVTATAGVEECADATITDNIPANTTFVDATTVNGPPTVTHGSPVTSVTWGSASIGGTPWELTLTVRVDDHVPDGTEITNTATPSGEPNNNFPGSATVRVRVPPPPECNLSIEKVAEDDTVFAGDDVTYDITVHNEGPGDCVNPVITDNLESDLTCQDATVVDDSGLDCDPSGCSSGDVMWHCHGVMDRHDRIEVQLVAETDSGLANGDDVDNTACVYGSTRGQLVTVDKFAAQSEVVGRESRDCDKETVEIETPVATPAPVQTPIVIIVPAPVPTVPAAAPLPTLAAPPTGTGPEGSSTSWALPIGLGLGGLCLIALSGTALAKKRAR